jgi:hypothetical protein
MRGAAEANALLREAPIAWLERAVLASMAVVVLVAED